MDQDKQLKELRAQRELIQKHLEWLDQKIDALKEDESPSTPADQEAPPEAQDDAPPGTVELEIINEAPLPEHDDVLDKEFGHYRSIGDEIRRAKIGCLLLFVCTTLLFLFLLFGLPYLMD